MEVGGTTCGGNGGKWKGVAVGVGRGKRSVIAAKRKITTGSEKAGIVFPVGRTARNLRSGRYAAHAQSNDEDQVFFGPSMTFFDTETEDGELNRWIMKNHLALLMMIAVWVSLTAIITNMLLSGAGVGKFGEHCVRGKVGMVLCYIEIAILVRLLVLPTVGRTVTRIVGARDAPTPAARVVYTCRLGVVLPHDRR